MDSMTTNDIQEIVENDRAHVWHHLIQHKPFETVDPRIIVEGKGNRVWDQKGKEHLITQRRIATGDSAWPGDCPATTAYDSCLDLGLEHNRKLRASADRIRCATCHCLEHS